jgi:iron complex transport system ATP-binding protein
VLHDLGQACRYADHVVAMQAGRVVASGDPREVVTETLVREVFGLPSRIVPDPVTGKPLVLPAARPPAGETAAPQTEVQIRKERRE